MSQKVTQIDKIPENAFGVSQRRSGDIRRRLAAKGIEVVSATRVRGLTYLEFKNEGEHERAVAWVYRWFETEFYDNHWKAIR